MSTLLYWILFTVRVGVLSYIIHKHGWKAGAASFTYEMLCTISDAIRRGKL